MLLDRALAHGYRIVSLEDWLRGEPEAIGTRTFILRHDVDQHPACALTMAAIEAERGVAATWYFRWRTAHPDVVTQVRDAGGAIGLHYETLTRTALQRQLGPGPELDALVPVCRDLLREEIRAFARLFGPITSVCPHGDSRVPGVTNQILLRGEKWDRYGIELDGNDAMNRHDLGAWLTDRSRPDGSWGKGLDPGRLFADGVGPILAVIHPNNWASGAGLWADRLGAAVLPRWQREGFPWRRPIRTGTDDPWPLASS